MATLSPAAQSLLFGVAQCKTDRRGLDLRRLEGRLEDRLGPV